MLKNIDRYLKNFKKDLEKLQKYSVTYGLDYLFNELDEVDYYEPKEVKSAFNGNYVLYESKGDKDSKLATYLMSGIETDDAINELFNSFRRRFQGGLETKMKGSSFIFERIDLLEYHLHKISLNRGSSYIKSFEWIKNKGVTINPKNTKDNNCFQYAITAALNYQNIDHHPERISKLRPFINNYNWKDIEFPSHWKD